MNTTITQIEDGKIAAEFVRMGKVFTLVAYHMHKTIPRDEALKIKNQYNMESIPTGYRGMVSKSEFIGGRKMELKN